MFLSCTAPGPGGSRSCKGWQIAGDNPPSDALRSALVSGSGSSAPDGDGAGEDGLHDGSLKVHHHRLWQVESLQLPQDVRPLLGSG